MAAAVIAAQIATHAAAFAIAAGSVAWEKPVAVSALNVALDNATDDSSLRTVRNGSVIAGGTPHAPRNAKRTANAAERAGCRINVNIKRDRYGKP